MTAELKPLTEFWRNRKSPDGHALYCIPCFRRRNAEAADRRAARQGRSRRPHKSPDQPVPDDFHFCPSCEAVLPLDDFVKNRTTATGYGTYCKPCQNAKATASRTRLHGSSRNYHLQRRYGIGTAEVAAMLADQSGCCAVCLRALAVKHCHVDHDHATGKARGILCFNCNGGLGQFRDDPRLLLQAADYLEGGAAAVAASRRDEIAWEVVLDRHGTGSPLIEQLFAARLAEHRGGPAS